MKIIFTDIDSIVVIGEDYISGGGGGDGLGGILV